MVLIIQNLVTKYTVIVIKVQHFDHNNISTALFIVKAVYCANYPSDEQIVTAATVAMYYNQQIIAKYCAHKLQGQTQRCHMLTTIWQLYKNNFQKLPKQ